MLVGTLLHWICIKKTPGNIFENVLILMSSTKRMIIKCNIVIFIFNMEITG